MQKWRSAFPDLSLRIETIVREGNTVMWTESQSGTQQGDFMGISASHRRLENVLTMTVGLAESAYPEPHDQARFYTSLISRVEATPGVTRAGANSIATIQSGAWSVTRPNTTA